MRNKLLLGIFITLGIGIFTLFLFSSTQDYSPEFQLAITPQETPLSKEQVSTTPLKTKKWNPGHYLQGYPLDTSPKYIGDEIKSDPRLQVARGVRIPITWKAFEPEKGQYNFALVDEYLEAIGPDKQMFFHWWATDIWANNCDTATRIPTYMLPHCTKLYSNTNTHANAGVKWWEPVPRAEMIRVLKAIGDHYDNNPQFEGIMFDETTFGNPPTNDISYADFEKAKLESYEIIHTAIAPHFATSQVIQPMNWLGGAGCTDLRDLADHLKSLGHGISNPDSVPWKALPRGCGTPYTDAPESRQGDMIDSHWWSIAVYTIYREYKNQLPIVVGGDASQFENPFTYPRIFNEVPMNATNLTDLLYKQAVTGYTYTPTGEFVPEFGANYILWERNFWSFNTPSTREITNTYIDAYYRIISDPNKKTNTACPSNIKCLGTSESLPNTPIPTDITGNICGKADTDGDGRFTIIDFVQFALAYGMGKNTCVDKDEDYGPCGGRDVNRDGKLSIQDFGESGIGFAQRYYPKTSCSL